jgi:subtilase family serine protease
MVLDVKGNASNVEQAFQIKLNQYNHPTKPRLFFAPDTDPSVPANVPVNDMWGLSDYSQPTPLAHKVASANISPLNYNGTGPSGAYQGHDFRNAYAPGAILTGSGQIAAVAEFDGYYTNDINTYEANCGYTNVPLKNVLISVDGKPGYSGVDNAVAEVSLDIEMIISMAPALSRLTVYEGNNPYDVFSRIVSDDSAKQISCSWSWGGSPASNWTGSNGSTLDSLLKEMVTQGQSFFQASGDSDAYTGGETINSTNSPMPADSIYVTSVGGTSLTMSGSGAAWSSETVWNWGGNEGSGGGISPNYAIPSWQTNVSMTANSGSTVDRNFPDVALTADAVEVDYNNGSSGVYGGTSCAAPLWAGFTALVNQQAAISGSSPVGFLNPALYAIAASTNYANCFHDITAGNNIGTNTPGLYDAVTNYDLATGLGTPNGTNLINALAPLSAPFFISQPVSQTGTNGLKVSFSVSASGHSPLIYQWLFNGASLPAATNISGITSNTVTLSPVTSANAGNYSVVVTNNFGAITSSVAALTVVVPPVFSSEPVSQSAVAGENALFSASVIGSTPLVYQWRQNGTNLVNGSNLSGATSNVLSLTAITANSAGSYTLLATNSYGTATSSVATLTVYLPAAITTPPAAQTIQCGSNANFTVAATGTAPVMFQWSLDGAAISAATNTTLSLTNIHLPGHTIAVLVTNLYGSATSSVPLTVQDTLPPVVTLSGANPIYVELGGAYIEPGATAIDPARNHQRLG